MEWKDGMPYKTQPLGKPWCLAHQKCTRSAREAENFNTAHLSHQIKLEDIKSYTTPKTDFTTNSSKRLDSSSHNYHKIKKFVAIQIFTGAGASPAHSTLPNHRSIHLVIQVQEQLV